MVAYVAIKYSRRLTPVINSVFTIVLCFLPAFTGMNKE